ncbi:MAG: hypothetical protein RBR38_15065 [Desulfomicrobium apsheronum]|nr:hypothetical protein [Desulfomicrobium apsheronum]
MELAHREEMEAMEEYRCVCGKVFTTLHGLQVHCGRAEGVHELEGDAVILDAEPATDRHDERATRQDAPQAAPDAPGAAQAPAPDPMPEPQCEICGSLDVVADFNSGAYLCAQCAEEQPHVTLRDLLEDGISVKFVERTPDYRMELIETLADLADRELYIAEHIDPEERDFSLVYDTLARIKAVVRS